MIRKIIQTLRTMRKTGKTRKRKWNTRSTVAYSHRARKHLPVKVLPFDAYNRTASRLREHEGRRVG
jgi:hypothetical protein